MASFPETVFPSFQYCWWYPATSTPPSGKGIKFVPTSLPISARPVPPSCLKLSLLADHVRLVRPFFSSNASRKKFSISSLFPILSRPVRYTKLPSEVMDEIKRSSLNWNGLPSSLFPSYISRNDFFPPALPATHSPSSISHIP